MTSQLSHEEIRRYSRHLIMPEVGMDGQRKLKEASEYKNDSRNGHFTSYYETGVKEMEGEYLADKKTGKWSVYDKTGKLTETLFYENDEIYEIR